MRLLLASTSPRRQALIKLLGLPWEVRVAPVDESSVDHADPATNAIQTALLKASALVKQLKGEESQQETGKTIIVAADTIVTLDGCVLNKPASPEEARRMLMMLRGRVHQVHSGLAIILLPGEKSLTDVATINVPMRTYDDLEIESYVATGDPLDKAGAYAIQHPGFKPVSGLSDCYAAVVGLPLCHLARNLMHLGILPIADVPANCQDFHEYQCPVYSEILSGNM